MKSNEPIAVTPEPPYYSVVFTSCRTDDDDGGYAVAAKRMIELAAQQEGFLGVESVRDTARVGITVSYWRDLDSIHKWHQVSEHKDAQLLGRSKWYESFSVRVCRVEREYRFDRGD